MKKDLDFVRPAGIIYEREDLRLGNMNGEFESESRHQQSEGIFPRDFSASGNPSLLGPAGVKNSKDRISLSNRNHFVDRLHIELYE
jgi:hypothetical protein